MIVRDDEKINWFVEARYICTTYRKDDDMRSPLIGFFCVYVCEVSAVPCSTHVVIRCVPKKNQLCNCAHKHR